LSKQPPYQAAWSVRMSDAIDQRFVRWVGGGSEGAINLEGNESRSLRIMLGGLLTAVYEIIK
jgi:hypothetical protein